jgi:hypothetical protein
MIRRKYLDACPLDKNPSSHHLQDITQARSMVERV